MGRKLTMAAGPGQGRRRPRITSLVVSQVFMCISPCGFETIKFFEALSFQSLAAAVVPL
jgi:hypothetical protein